MKYLNLLSLKQLNQKKCNIQKIHQRIKIKNKLELKEFFIRKEVQEVIPVKIDKVILRMVKFLKEKCYQVQLIL